jgi:hypothetical protein
MKAEKIVEQAKIYFGKNRKRLKEKVLAFEFNGKQYLNWKKQFKELTSHPFIISYGIFDDVSDWVREKDYKEIDWHWLGDLSWEFKVLLNNGVEKGFDWDKRLAINCNGTARIVQFFTSDIIPCFVYDVYYMTYNKKENYFEFGPISELTKEESELIDKIKKFFQKSGFTFLSKTVAMKRHKELYSDCNTDGNARVFDALFSDTENYQSEIKRFNDKSLKDSTGKEISWNEFYDKKHNLLKREEFRYFPSKNVECVITDSSGQIIEIKIWRDIGRKTHQEFTLNILEEHKKQKLKK